VTNCSRLGGSDPLGAQPIWALAPAASSTPTSGFWCRKANSQPFAVAPRDVAP